MRKLSILLMVLVLVFSMSFIVYGDNYEPSWADTLNEEYSGSLEKDGTTSDSVTAKVKVEKYAWFKFNSNTVSLTLEQPTTSSAMGSIESNRVGFQLDANTPVSISVVEHLSPVVSDMIGKNLVWANNSDAPGANASNGNDNWIVGFEPRIDDGTGGKLGEQFRTDIAGTGYGIGARYNYARGSHNYSVYLAGTWRYEQGGNGSDVGTTEATLPWEKLKAGTYEGTIVATVSAQ